LALCPRCRLALRGRCPQASVSETLYTDVNGDDIEDAMVILTDSTGGTGSWEYVYMYTIARGAVTLMAAFETGSRTVHRLHRVCVGNGHLIIELNEPDGNQGLCCATAKPHRVSMARRPFSTGRRTRKRTDPRARAHLAFDSMSSVQGICVPREPQSRALVRNSLERKGRGPAFRDLRRSPRIHFESINPIVRFRRFGPSIRRFTMASICIAW